jgi:hypothetical protein
MVAGCRAFPSNLIGNDGQSFSTKSIGIIAYVVNLLFLVVY